MADRIAKKYFPARTALLFFCLCRCVSNDNHPSLPFAMEGFSDLKRNLLTVDSDLELFTRAGPFRVKGIKDYPIRLSPETLIDSDLYLSEHTQKAPLVIIQHGNESWKEAHRKQALHLASWGMHCLVLQLPNTKTWMKNGSTLAEVATLISRWPNLISERLDVEAIIVAGHSFGGSAAVIAAGLGAPVSGLILLDPAVVKKDVVHFMKQVKVPVMLLGADEKVFMSRKRQYFFAHIPKHIAEVSLRGATHSDAQYPTDTELRYFGFDLKSDENLQRKFVASLTASAFSIAATRGLDYSWQIFEDEMRAGGLVKAVRK